ncbi:breast and ovarian cancer susceptibility 2 [Anopheles sinensis]|uniref:Breast and ovarian cancer susceptibility 2 n=1 Tax=Anopheles sinensis TaxID=74873 RepID=A0A084W5A1_ANOSI|nr:breast and ovarian cancer susceptibility 2 [Anopheles sinensis]
MASNGTQSYPKDRRLTSNSREDVGRELILRIPDHEFKEPVSPQILTKLAKFGGNEESTK